MTVLLRTALTVLYLAHGITPPYTRFNDLLVYRGTTSFQDVVRDVDIRRDEFYGLRVHRGLLRMYQEHKCEDVSPEILGGYSCGGVLSLLHAVESTVKHGRPPRMVITIASPRFVTKESLPLLRKLLRHTTVVRVHNVHDLIPSCPPNLQHIENVVVRLESTQRDPFHAHASTTYATLLERINDPVPPSSPPAAPAPEFR